MKYQAIDSEYIREMKERDEFLRQKGWLMKGMKYGYFIAIIIIILSAFFNGNLVLATPNDLNYEFQDEVLIDEINPEIVDFFNLKNETEYTGLYNATYSFTNDNNGDFPFGWIDNDGINCETTVEGTLNGHDKVLKFNDTSASASARAEVNVNQGLNSIFEFWMTKDSIAGNTIFQLYLLEGATVIVRLRWDNNDLDYVNSTPTFVSIKDDFLIIDILTHFKLVLNDATNTFDCYINGVLEGTGLDYNNPSTLGIDNLYFRSDNADTDYISYIDGFGYSGDNNYEINDNLIPYLEINTLAVEPDKFEFDYETGGTVYTGFLDNYSTWDVIEEGDASATVNSMQLPYATDLNRGLRFWLDDGDTGKVGINKTFSITSNIVETGFTIDTVDHYSGPPTVPADGIFYYEVYSSDLTKIISLKIEYHDDIFFGYRVWYDDGGYIEILDQETSPVGFNPVDINLYIDYDTGYFNFESLYSGDNELFLPLLDTGKTGIGLIEAYGTTGDTSVYIDYIYVYDNGVSVSDDWGYYTVNINSSTDVEWDYKLHNLVTINMNNTCSIAGDEGTFIGGNIYPFTNYTDFSDETIINVYDIFQPVPLEAPSLVFFFNETHSLSNINSIRIEGVSLNEGANKYWMTLKHSGITIINESYFYVLDNNLYFTMTTDDSNLEYMEISFDIPNTVASNRSLKYSGVKSASSLEAQFKVIYTDSSYNPFELEPDYKNLAVLLPRIKTIDSISLLISDNDNDVNDTITGFIGSFDLIYVPLITTDFISISFFDALPIVVLVVVIPIALYVGFGKKKELLIPSIIAMSIFGTAVGLIPLWLTFVIGFGCVSALIIQSRS